MRQKRFYCGDLEVGDTPLCADESHHALHVLRCRSGESVELFNGQGALAQGKISDIGGKRVIVRIEQTPHQSEPIGRRLTLITALPRRPRQPTLFEKCCELGVCRIIATNFERSAVKATSKAVKRWRRTTIEAAKQCESLFLPEISLAESLEASFDKVGPNTKRLFGDPQTSNLLAEALDDFAGQEIAVWIGPEGGFSDAEKSRLIDGGAVAVRFSPNVLRIETACITTAAIIAASVTRPSKNKSAIE